MRFVVGFICIVELLRLFLLGSLFVKYPEKAYKKFDFVDFICSRAFVARFKERFCLLFAFFRLFRFFFQRKAEPPLENAAFGSGVAFLLTLVAECFV